MLIIHPADTIVAKIEAGYAMLQQELWPTQKLVCADALSTLFARIYGSAWEAEKERVLAGRPERKEMAVMAARHKGVTTALEVYHALILLTVPDIQMLFCVFDHKKSAESIGRIVTTIMAHPYLKDQPITGVINSHGRITINWACGAKSFLDVCPTEDEPTLELDAFDSIVLDDAEFVPDELFPPILQANVSSFIMTGSPFPVDQPVHTFFSRYITEQHVHTRLLLD
jgi:hypothetical protein